LPGPHTRFHRRRLKERGEVEQGFLLQRVQPALSGLMDGSLSTLAPIFAVVIATHDPHTAFFTGLATALGAGVSMAFSEGLSDTGDLTGRGRCRRVLTIAKSRRREAALQLVSAVLKHRRYRLLLFRHRQRLGAIGSDLGTVRVVRELLTHLAGDPLQFCDLTLEPFELGAELLR
jgi:hypothetical protein